MWSRFPSLRIGTLFAISTLLGTTVSGQYSGCNFLCNVDFEQETLVQNGQFGFFDQDRVSCWSTTATDRMIEIWGSGFGGVPAYSGRQFAELNANMVSTLYQDFTAAPGGSVEISFAHRGRAGLDRMSVDIGPVGGPYETLGTFSADNKAWVFNTLNYRFPDTGSRAFTIRFRSVSAAGGATVGNFLDAISIRLPGPQVDFLVQQPECPDDSSGSVAIHNIDGARPFRYLWSTPNSSTDSFLHDVPPGVYPVEVTDYYGCSRIFQVKVEAKHKADTIEVHESACLSYSWLEAGERYSQSGRYAAQFKNQAGCDSLVLLDLTIHQSDSNLQSVSTCSSFWWPVNGKTYTQSGRYTDTMTNSFGCDSILILDLIRLPGETQVFRVRQCSPYTWPVNGITYAQSGRYADTLTNRFGCDSILVLELEPLPGEVQRQSVRSCQEYFWPVNGKRYTNSGRYVDSLLNQAGCDSIWILDLEILPAVYEQLIVDHCYQYTWPVSGKTYFQSGRYSDTLRTAIGCDSILILDLTLFGSSRSSLDITHCDSYTWPANGKHYLQSVRDSFITSSSRGCDSVIYLNLRIQPSYAFRDSVRRCGTYTWPVNGRSYDQSGSYSLALQTGYSCDSIYYLDLTIDPDYSVYDTVSSLDFYYWPVNWKRYDNSGMYREFYRTREGCDSLHILILDIRRRGTIYIPNVFTPNGDGINDKFTVFSSPEIKSVDRLLIFDRWGELLYEASNLPTNDPNSGWDGRFRSKDMNAAVFVYLVEWTDLEGEKRMERGDGTLVR